MLQRLAFSDLGTVEVPLALALGVFDGLHRGHQAVIAEAIRSAREIGGLAGVVTFWPHPIQVVAPHRAPAAIILHEAHREKVLSALHLDLLITIEFDESFANQEPEEFFEELRGAPFLRSIAVGQDWKFGRKRRGDVDLLSSLARLNDIEVTAVAPVKEGGERISSTRIRQALRDGNLDAVERMLGRRYSVMGVVCEGRKLGRELGFPTANLVPDEEQLPLEGVWAVRVLVDEELVPGMANLGSRPTVSDEPELLLEVNLFDWDGELYGHSIEVVFVERIRDIEKFQGLEELVAQLKRDREKAKGILSKSDD